MESTSTVQIIKVAFPTQPARIAPQSTLFSSPRYSSRQSGIQGNSINLPGPTDSSRPFMFNQGDFVNLSFPSPLSFPWIISDKKGKELDTAITQTASSVGKGIPCKRLGMQDVMCTMRVPSHLCFRRVGVRCLRRRIRRRLIHASGGRLPKRTCMFVSGTSWREDELVLMEFDLRVSMLPGNMPVTYA